MEELDDIHRGVQELKAGKAKRFPNVRDAIEWLHRNRTEPARRKGRKNPPKVSPMKPPPPGPVSRKTPETR